MYELFYLKMKISLFAETSTRTAICKSVITHDKENGWFQTAVKGLSFAECHRVTFCHIFPKTSERIHEKPLFSKHTALGL
jgi:hypothetical protein